MSVEINISNIKEEEFKFSDGDLNVIDSKLLSLGFHLGFDVDVKKSILTVKVTIVYNYGNTEKEQDIELMRFSTGTSFKVKGLKKIIEFEDDDKFEIPDQIMATFVGVAISSTRGMLVYKLAGTILSDFYLPLIDVESLIKDYNTEE